MIELDMKSTVELKWVAGPTFCLGKLCGTNARADMQNSRVRVHSWTTMTLSPSSRHKTSPQ